METKMRIMALRRIGLLLALLIVTTLNVSAQDTGSRLLQPGVAVTASIDAANPAQVYTFIATAPQPVSVTASADPGLALTLVLTDSGGNLIAQVVDNAASGNVSLDGVPLPGAGLHYLTVFPAAGSATVTTGNFSLTLTLGTTAQPSPQVQPTAAATDAPVDTVEPTLVPTDVVATPAPESEATSTESEDLTTGFNPGQVLTTAGLQVALSWNNTSDLNLEIRDPVGQRLFFDSTATNNGGAFGFDVNGLCEVLTADNPTETATWAPGAIPTGSYEMLVYYRQDCQNNGPTDFSLNVTVDGVPQEPVIATLAAPVNNVVPVYIASFKVGPDASVSFRPDGLYQDTRVLPKPAAEFLAEPAETVVPGTAVQGLITSESYYQLYSFDAAAGETYSVSMTALDGSLDTLLLVLDPNGQIVGDNDDIIAGEVTNSAIDSPPLTTAIDGRYTIIATRYGKDVGGTEGNFELRVTTGGTVAGVPLPEELQALALPDGDIEVLLTWQTNADLQLLVRDTAGDSVYDDVRSVISGGQLVEDGNIGCTVSDGAPVSYIYWPFGTARGGTYEVEVWYQNECEDTRPVNFTLYITVNGEQLYGRPVFIQQGDRFVTSFTLNTDNTAVLSQAGIIGGSETLAGLYTQADINAAPQVASGVPQFGNITPANKFDLYTFEADAGQVVTINMRRSQGSLDTKLFLISPIGFEIAENDDAVPGETTDSLINGFVLPESGQYLIIATHFGTIYGGTTGSYELSLTLE